MTEHKGNDSKAIENYLEVYEWQEQKIRNISKKLK